MFSTQCIYVNTLLFDMVNGYDALVPPVRRLVVDTTTKLAVSLVAVGVGLYFGPVFRFRQLTHAPKKARDHPAITTGAPACISILALVRDAIMRLPNGIGSAGVLFD